MAESAPSTPAKTPTKKAKAPKQASSAKKASPVKVSSAKKGHPTYVDMVLKAVTELAPTGRGKGVARAGLLSYIKKTWPQMEDNNKKRMNDGLKMALTKLMAAGDVVSITGEHFGNYRFRLGEELRKKSQNKPTSASKADGKKKTTPAKMRAQSPSRLTPEKMKAKKTVAKKTPVKKQTKEKKAAAPKMKPATKKSTPTKATTMPRKAKSAKA